MTKLIIKTKSLSISKNSLRCKLEIKAEMIEWVMLLHYLGTISISCKNFTDEMRKQTQKKARIAESLKEIVGENKWHDIWNWDTSKKLIKQNGWLE